MRVLVVAATGFIGGHVARAFQERGDSVWGLVRSSTRAATDPRLRGVQVIEGRAESPPAEVEAVRPDVIVYAAGVWRVGDRAPFAAIERRCHDVYVRGVENAAELGLRSGAHVVLLSGISRFGSAAASGSDGVALREDTPPRLLNIYGEHKRRAEDILASAAARGLRWTAIVPPDVYGAGDPGSHVLFVHQRMRQRRFVLLGDGGARWSLCHVQNVADAVVHFAEGPGRGPLNIADARDYTQAEIAREVARAMGRADAWIPRVPRAWALAIAALNERLPRPPSWPQPFGTRHVRLRTRDVLIDTSRATSLGFEPKASLRDGVADTVAGLRALNPRLM